MAQPARNAVQAALLPPDAPGDDKLIGLTIAIVGGEPITLRQLQTAVKEWREENVPEGRNLGRDELNMVATELLEHLIDRTLLVQEAKRKLLSDDKKLHAFEEFAGARFKEDELPKLLRKHKVGSERELSDLLEQKGLTLYDMKQKYLYEALSQEYLRETLKSQLIRPELDAMWAYYQAHLDEFQQTAQVKWREIVVRIDEAPGQREAARRKAEALLSQVRQGQDFAALATLTKRRPDGGEGRLLGNRTECFGDSGCESARWCRCRWARSAGCWKGPTASILCESKAAVRPGRFRLSKHKTTC